MIKSLVIAHSLLVLVTISPLFSQTFTPTPASLLHYFPSPEGPGISACSPGAFQCDFGLTGTVTLTMNGPTATIDATSLELLGNDGVTAGDGRALSEALKAWKLIPFSDFVFEEVGEDSWQYSEPPEELSTITATLQGDRLVLVGGIDETWVDGDGYQFNLTALAVPEPSMPILFLGVASLWPLRFQRRTHA